MVVDFSTLREKKENSVYKVIKKLYSDKKLIIFGLKTGITIQLKY